MYTKHSFLVLIASVHALGVFFSIYTWTLTGGRETGLVSDAQRATGGQHVARWAGLCQRQSDTIMQGCSWLSAVDCISTVSELYLRKPGAFMQNCTFSLCQMFPIRKSSRPPWPFDFIEMISIMWKGWWGVHYEFSPSSRRRTVGGTNSAEDNDIV